MRNGDYELIVAPDDYPGKKYRGRYAYEHRVNYWREHGTLPPVVHHVNERKRDNAPRNLEGKTVAKHIADHSRERGEPPVRVRCRWCGAWRMIAARNKRWQMKAGQRNFFCSRSHSAKYQWEQWRKTRPQHGVAAYQRGCRCIVCRTAQSDRMRAYKAHR